MTTRFTTPALSPMVPGTAAQPRRTLRTLMAAIRRTLSDLDSRLPREATLSDAAHTASDITWLPPRGPRLRHGETPRPSPGRRIARVGAATQGWLAAAWWRYRSRQHIASLDAALLKDIGVTFAEAEYEANLPFWR